MGGFFSRPKKPSPPPPPPPPPKPEDPKKSAAKERRKAGKIRGMGYGQGTTLGGTEEATTARTILGQ
jgi:hypothetical protein